MQRVIVVSNRLPLRRGDSGEWEPTAGGLASALEAVASDGRLRWIGWPGAEIAPGEQAAVAEGLAEATGFAPVFLTALEIDGFYAGYANATLWPILHYQIGRARFDPNWFAAYEAANHRFAEAAAAMAEPEDIVWVQDYQLMRVPQILKSMRPELKVGFFLHVPFPSYEVFRVIPERRRLLEGLLGADLIGFHTFGYLRHFRSSLLRVLGVDAEPGRVIWRGRTSRLAVHPIGINGPGFEAVMAGPEFDAAMQGAEERFAGRKLVLSVERLDYSKGIPQKLAAIRRFLAQAPDWRDRVIFLILAVPSRQDVQAYQELTEQVQRAVSRINGELGSFGHVPVHFHQRGTDAVSLAALYARAEVALVTPLVDGMNLVAKEFVACKGSHPLTRPGTLILSELAGAAQELFGATLVNPYDAQQVADAIREALERTPEEAAAGNAPMRTLVLRRDAHDWAHRFLADLALCDPSLPSALRRPGPEELECLRLPSLAVFLDYDGTLRDFTDDPEAALPAPETLALLRRLAAAPGIRLAILSGRVPAFLERHLGGIGCTLVSEHGYQWLRRDRGEAAWSLMNPQADVSWKDQVRPILEQVAELTPGSHVEEKASALVWHYRRADPEFGRWRAGELLGELTEAVANLPVEVHHGKAIVEVSSQQVNKGAALRALIEDWRPDAVLALGDDQTDEAMFALRDDWPHFLAVKVGVGETRASHQLPDPAAVHAFLDHVLALRDA